MQALRQDANYSSQMRLHRVVVIPNPTVYSSALQISKSAQTAYQKYCTAVISVTVNRIGAAMATPISIRIVSCFLEQLGEMSNLFA